MMAQKAMELDRILAELRDLFASASAGNGIRIETITPEHRRRAELIVEAVAKVNEMPARMIYARGRTQPAAMVRQICMTLIRSKLGLSTYQTGPIFRLGHGAVLVAEKAVNDRIATDTKFAMKWITIRNAVDEALSK